MHVNYREYGKAPYKAIVVHGGPGAAGSAAGICRGLSSGFGVIEILQSKNSIKELTKEMLDVITAHKLEKIVIIGHSWGAWLSFIFAATYPEYAAKLILVGSGLFDVKYYQRLIEARNVKTVPTEQKEDIRAANIRLSDTEFNPDNYCVPQDVSNDMIAFNKEQFDSLMTEIMPIRDSGELLNYSEKIKCPVIAIHGKNDPHVLDGVKIPLESRLSDFKMYALEKCGHEPWKEYYARDKFFEILKAELTEL